MQSSGLVRPLFGVASAIVTFSGSELPSSFTVGFHHPSAAEEEPPRWNERQEGRRQGVGPGPCDCTCALANCCSAWLHSRGVSPGQWSLTSSMLVLTTHGACCPYCWASMAENESGAAGRGLYLLTVNPRAPSCQSWLPGTLTADACPSANPELTDTVIN